MPRRPKAPAVPADKKGSSPCVQMEAELMQERFKEAQQLRRQIAELERKLDRILNLDYARRAPAKRTLTRAQASAVFDAIEERCNERCQA